MAVGQRGGGAVSGRQSRYPDPVAECRAWGSIYFHVAAQPAGGQRLDLGFRYAAGHFAATHSSLPELAGLLSQAACIDLAVGGKRGLAVDTGQVGETSQ